MLASSLVPAAASPSGGVGVDLEFLDSLAARPLVCRDEAVHAVLLLGNGCSAPTAEQREALAVQLGYLRAPSGRSPREAATIGEVAQMLVAVMEGGSARSPGVSQQEALARLAERRIVPSAASPFQGLTGAQLLTMVGEVRMATAERPLPMARLGDTPPTAPASDAPALVSAEPGAAASATSPPLPAEARAPEIERSVTTEPAGSPEPAPRAARPSPTTERDVSPTEPPAAAPPARQWVPGKPLKRSGK